MLRCIFDVSRTSVFLFALLQISFLESLESWDEMPEHHASDILPHWFRNIKKRHSIMRFLCVTKILRDEGVRNISFISITNVEALECNMTDQQRNIATVKRSLNILSWLFSLLCVALLSYELLPTCFSGGQDKCMWWRELLKICGRS